MNDLSKKLNKLNNNLHRNIMLTVSVEAEKFYRRSFDNEGFTDRSREKWKAVHRKSGGKILTQSGRLADTLRASISGSEVKISSPLPYARVHNEGGKAGRNGSVTIPKRQFVGESAQLNEIIDKEITALIERELN